MKKNNYSCNSISESTQIEGTIVSQGKIVISGKIVGSIEGHDQVVFEKTGSINGPIRAKKITIKGNVKGDIFSNGIVEILEGGQVTSNITTSKGGVSANKGSILNCTFSTLDGSNSTHRALKEFKKSES